MIAYAFFLKKKKIALFTVHGFSCPHVIKQIAKAVKNNYRK